MARANDGSTMRALAVAVALAVALAVVAAGAVAATDDATLELVENASTDETVSVDLRTSASSVAGYQANVTYDEDVLSVRSIEGVALPKPEENDDLTGAVDFTQSQQRTVDEPTLATITFDVVGEGTTDLEFVLGDEEDPETVVNDENGDHLDVTLEGLTVDTTDDDGGGGIGGIGGGGGQDSDGSDPDDAEADDDANDGTETNETDDDTDANETPDDEQPDAPDEEPSDEESSDETAERTTATRARSPTRRPSYRAESPRSRSGPSSP